MTQDETLWEFMLQYLKHDRRCAKCNERLWVGYSDGHVWDQCLACKPEFTLDLAGYITTYPVPEEPLPNCIEVRTDPAGILPYAKPHEQFYRMKPSRTPVNDHVTVIDDLE